MFKPIGAIVAQGLVSGDFQTRRTGKTTSRAQQPVRRESHLAGRCEAGFWSPTTRKEVQEILAAARRYEVTTRQPGARNGALGHVAMEVLALLANLVDFKTGRLEPSLKFLMRKLRRSKDAIHRALNAPAASLIGNADTCRQAARTRDRKFNRPATPTACPLQNAPDAFWDLLQPHHRCRTTPRMHGPRKRKRSPLM
ncbi:hypothetical protein CUJ84_pRLN3000550 (plasmid) [Rhizobium leguminosarum]|uniref:Uncharacterized protein n=1 Tax=Rhizobium leguminosarum TaxID=384 RepID=A0A2K9ZHF8_RHILE|nr:hypothetical protein CUJ84_pRLN3000550 [Rhizobium leguminosarum]